jgi:hypothetical protein
VHIQRNKVLGEVRSRLPHARLGRAHAAVHRMRGSDGKDTPTPNLQPWGYTPFDAFQEPHPEKAFIMKQPHRNKTDDPQLVAAAYPVRDARRPLECTFGGRCWVKLGRAGLMPDSAAHTPRCIECGGVIR